MTELVTFNFALKKQENVGHYFGEDGFFKWRTAGGRGFISVNKMKTTHLVNTVKMIWNNTVHPKYRFWNAVIHNFAPYYTTPYMQMAVYYCALEISVRPDLTATEKRILKTMIEHMNRREGVVFALDQCEPCNQLQKM